jgi:muramidase (phage lysozyme)
MNTNRIAFLTMIAFSEGTSTNPLTKNNGYDVIVTGADLKPEVFTDYSNHPFANGRPSKVINSKGLTSNASGRYQFMLRDWAYYRALLKLPDFSPASQDAWALQLIKERGGLALIDAGQLSAAIAKCSNLWASFPGANYPGQRMNEIALLQSVYIKAGGTVA